MFLKLSKRSEYAPDAPIACFLNVAEGCLRLDFLHRLYRRDVLASFSCLVVTFSFHAR
ncbi:hypothetical protein HNR39_004490, partial [Glaciimonas immobilis]|nr:hypothetical protein [Glaciimonas immobilis]